jgi:hypothetical protein
VTTPYVPKDTFISNYMEYMADQETPAVYDFACACWILSNALGRSVIVDRPRAPVHLNMYVILVSESGIMRKSTSIRHATSMLRQFYDETSSKTMLIESKASAGAITSELHHSSIKNGYAHMVFSVSELAAGFGRAAGVSALTALLTDLYDCPDVRTGGGSLSHGSMHQVNLKDVYMGFLGGTTPSWLASAVTPTIIEGGFTSRCYFVVGRQRKRAIAWPAEAGEAYKTARRRLIDQLKELVHESANTSRIGISDSGLDTFRRWYEARLIHRDIYRESFESREDGHVLRYAGLFAANERHWRINNDHIERAIRTVGNIKSDGTGLFTAANTKELDLKWLRKLRDVLLKAGEVGISRMDLTRTMNARGLRTQEMRSTLFIMKELDLVSEREVSFPGQAGRPKTMYHPTIYLQNEAFLQDVTRKLGLDQ